MSQTDMILSHLKEHGSITQMEAADLYGCFRLAARISDLREAGHIIYTDTETGKNRYGKSTAYARYRLEEADG